MRFAMNKARKAREDRVRNAAPALLQAVLLYRNDMLHPSLTDDSRARRLEMVNALITLATGEK